MIISVSLKNFSVSSRFMDKINKRIIHIFLKSCQENLQIDSNKYVNVLTNGAQSMISQVAGLPLCLRTFCIVLS